MTAKDKAIELCMKYFNLETVTVLSQEDSKQCALIAVDEILENIKEWDFTNDNSDHHFWFWQKVKEEINKL